MSATSDGHSVHPSTPARSSSLAHPLPHATPSPDTHSLFSETDGYTNLTQLFALDFPEDFPDDEEYGESLVFACALALDMVTHAALTVFKFPCVCVMHSSLHQLHSSTRHHRQTHTCAQSAASRDTR